MDSWKDIANTTWRGFRHFVPGMAITWLMVEVVAAQVPSVAFIAQCCFFILLLPYYTAAAVRASELTDQGAFALAFSRTGMLMEVVGLAFAFLFVIGIGLVVVAKVAELWVTVLVPAVFGVLLLYFVARAWPAWAISFFFEGEIRWSPAARGSSWQGPGLGAAWNLTGRFGLFNPYTRRFMAAFLLLSSATAALKLWLEATFLGDLLLYVVGLPLLAQVAVAAVAEMLIISGAEYD